MINRPRFAALTLSAALIAAPMYAQTIQVNKDNKTIAITTSDEAEATADVAVVTVGFHIYGNDQDSTYAEASRTSNAITKALQDSGIKPEAIESANQSLSPIDEQDKLHYAKGLRFSFEQSWHVTVPAKAAADTLHAAITAGANDSGGIQWKLAHDDVLEAEAAEKALAHAQQIAERMTKGLHAKLGPLVYASNQTPRIAFNGMVLQTQSASVSSTRANLKPLAISPERISKSATVYAVFAIE
jgi:uncharacterized protein